MASLLVGLGCGAETGRGDGGDEGHRRVGADELPAAVGLALLAALLLFAAAVFDEGFDCQNRQLVFAREFDEIGHARHCAVTVHDLTDDAHRAFAGQAAEVDRCFSVAGAHQDTAVACDEWKYMARPHEVFRARCRVGKFLYRDLPVVC